LFLAIGACTCVQTENGRIVRDNGTVVYIELEGGFYGIITEQDKQYNPINLPEAFKQDSLSVYFEGRIREDIVSIQQWGTIIELSSIRLDST